MRIGKRQHLAYLKRKFSELNRLYLRELKYGRSSLQYIRDICEVIQTLRREIRSLENDGPLPGLKRISLS
ncbi:MAG TPA: hypothetical protein VF145_04425 [Chitinophagaceae bacterium]